MSVSSSINRLKSKNPSDNDCYRVIAAASGKTASNGGLNMTEMRSLLVVAGLDIKPIQLSRKLLQTTLLDLYKKLRPDLSILVDQIKETDAEEIETKVNTCESHKSTLVRRNVSQESMFAHLGTLQPFISSSSSSSSNLSDKDNNNRVQRTKNEEVIYQEYKKLEPFECELDAANGIFHGDRDFVAIGDIHGDIRLLEHQLTTVTQVASKTRNGYRWKGGNKLVIFLGDLIDSYRDDNAYYDPDKVKTKLIHELKPEVKASFTDTNLRFRMENILDGEFQILRILRDLDKQAAKEFGRVLILIGNHELMHFLCNIEFIRNYSTAGMGAVLTPMTRSKTDDAFNKGRTRASHQRCGKFQIGQEMYNAYRNRAGSNFLACVVVGKWVFCHGSMRNASEFLGMDSNTSMLDIVSETNRQLNDLLTSPKRNHMLDPLVTNLFIKDVGGVMWDRKWSTPTITNKATTSSSLPSSLPLCTRCDCPHMSDVNTDYRFVIAHSIQLSFGCRGSMFTDYEASAGRIRLSGTLREHRDDKELCLGINVTCDGRVWRIDTGSSRAFDLSYLLDKRECSKAARFAQALAIEQGSPYVYIAANQGYRGGDKSMEAYIRQLNYDNDIDDSTDSDDTVIL